MPDDDDEMREILKDFLVESTEIVESLPLDILALETKPKEEALLNKLFRGVHTIKGAAGFLGFVKLAQFTHKLEDFLNKLRRFEIPADAKAVDLLLSSTDILRQLIERIRDAGDDACDTEAGAQKLDAMLKGVSAPAPKSEPLPTPAKVEALVSAPQPAKADPAPEAIPIPKADVVDPEPPPGKKKIGEILVAEKVIDPEDLEKALQEQSQAPKIGEILTEKKLVTEAQLQDALQKQGPAAEPSASEQTIRVDVRRLDHLMNFVGELVLSRNRLQQLHRVMQGIGLSESFLSLLNETIQEIAFNTSELQMGVMKTRMMPISRVFSKFQRLIRELEKQTGKALKLEIHGEETELDKTIIEEIGDPLIHLVRNSADHGVEMPDERVSKGKPREGLIRLSASHQGNHIVIEIQDDGRGMNLKRISEKAVQNKLVSAERVSQMSRQEILELIFLPGFSTAEKVTDLSGRGVGMDVVKSKVTQLKGMIEIDTLENKGSTLRLKLPLTLAIIQVLVVSVRDFVFSIPLTSVVETLRIRKEDICFVEGREVIEYRGRILPLAFLRRLYRLDHTELEDESKTDWVYLVIVGLGEKMRGVVVDRFLEQEEIVIKSLTRFLSMVKGFSGCTIMGDGKISLIVDVEHLFHWNATGSLEASLRS